MLELRRQLNCTFADSEKAECIPIIAKMIKLCDKARAYGLLSLTDINDSESNILIKTGIALGIDVIPPETISEILQTTILADGHKGSELLIQIIIAQSIMSIVNGETSQILAVRLSGMLGSEYLEKDEKYYRNYKV